MLLSIGGVHVGLDDALLFRYEGIKNSNLLHIGVHSQGPEPARVQGLGDSFVGLANIQCCQECTSGPRDFKHHCILMFMIIENIILDPETRIWGSFQP